MQVANLAQFSVLGIYRMKGVLAIDRDAHGDGFFDLLKIFVFVGGAEGDAFTT